jgi:20S proteasome alpha/beta subunit
MTYIIGINNYGASCIICDTRISYGQSGINGSNDALKSGKLFPGCIYGAAGNSDELRKFISSMRQTQDERNTLSGFWDNFCKFVSKYNFSKSKLFQLLLASRHTGDSKLYLLDPIEGSIKNAGNLVTIGSGKNLLDRELKEIHEQRNPKIIEYLQDQGVPIHSYPYLYCLWLMERVQGMEHLF